MDINLLPYKTLTKYIADIGYKKIIIDEIDEYYTDTNISNYYSDIKKQFFEIKNNAQKLLLDIDEVVDILKSILNEKDPEKLVEFTMDLNSYVGSHGIHFSTYDIEFQEEFGYALKEYKIKKEYLISHGYYDYYNSIFTSISEESFKQLISFYNEHTKEERDLWLGLSVKLELEKKELVSACKKTYN